MKKRIAIMFFLLAGVLAACGNQSTDDSKNNTASGSKEVNLYSSRHYDVDNELYKKFTKETGIKVNLIKGEADELLERIKREGDADTGGFIPNG